MENQNSFNMDARDWSKFAWDVIIDGFPAPTDLIGHELRNEFNGEIYRSADGELWGQYRSRAEIGPEELGPDDILEAYCDLFGDRENVEKSKKVFERAVWDKDIPGRPRKAVEKALDMNKGVENYKEIVQNSYNSEDTVNYGLLLQPIADKPYVNLNEEDMGGLRVDEKRVKIGESVFFFLNTVDKNFHEYVIGEVEDPELNIDAYVENDELVLDIYDNGPGISEKDARGIFRPEFGDGTGLPTANYIIEEYGGELNLYDEEEGFGLEARFELEGV